MQKLNNSFVFKTKTNLQDFSRNPTLTSTPIQNGPQVSKDNGRRDTDSILTRARNVDLKSFIRRNEKRAGVGSSTIRSNPRVPLSQAIESSCRSHAESDSLASVFDALKAGVNAEELDKSEKAIVFAEIVERVGNYVAEKDVDDSDKIFESALKNIRKKYEQEKRKISIGLPSELDDYFSPACLEKDLKEKKKRAPKTRCCIPQRALNHIEEFKQAMQEKESESRDSSVVRSSHVGAITTTKASEAKKVYPAWQRGENGFPVFNIPYNPIWVGEKAQLLKTAYYSQQYRVTGDEILQTPIHTSQTDSSRYQISGSGSSMAQRTPISAIQETQVTPEEKVEDITPCKKPRLEDQSEPQKIVKNFKDDKLKKIALARTDITRNQPVKESPDDNDVSAVQTEVENRLRELKRRKIGPFPQNNSPDNSLQELKRQKVDNFEQNFSPIKENENLSLTIDNSSLSSALENLSEISSIVDDYYESVHKKQPSTKNVRFQQNFSSDDEMSTICSPVKEQKDWHTDNISVLSLALPSKTDQPMTPSICSSINEEEDQCEDNMSTLALFLPSMADQRKVFEYKEISMQHGSKENPYKAGQSRHHYVAAREIMIEGNFPNFGPMIARHTRREFFHMS